jgi:glucuronoarabinoxylan endo-1,4-beta-xylanase
MKKLLLLILLITQILLLQSCRKNNNGNGDELKKYTVTIDPSITYQKMIGFGGSLTWYSDRIISSPNKTQICKLLFEDLGADMIRFKNNYYPYGYPATKTTDVMENSSIKTLFTTTNQLYTLAKQYNPDVEILISSWTPPSALKSNNNLRQGTLKKEDGVFMYEAFAEYWNDMLDNLPFNPDYISIQNEPGWVTPDWETCEWRGTETADFPGYVNAFDAVYNKISTRVNPPEMMGPEAENIGVSSKLGGNTFVIYSDPIKDKPYLAAYAYHTYNFSASTPISETKTLLNMIRDSYGNKPCVMTEYSNYSWFNTAQFILQNINEANASGYLYWLMAWDDANEQAMIKISSSGSYSASPFYYVMKHYSKNIDKDYDRIDAIISGSSLRVSAFQSPAGDKITLVIINPINYGAEVNFTVNSKTIKSVMAVQSLEGSFYKDLGSVVPTGYITLKPLSVTTVVMDI